MAILFLLAVLFAIPTYGLSLLAWIVLALMRGKSRADRVIERDNRKVFIEPLFTGQFAEFFRALDMPFYVGETIDHDDAHKCGRHIMNYIAHNPVEGKVFMQGLNKWRTKGDYSPCHPVVAANDERTLDRKGEIHLVAYRAVEAIMTNNPNLPCFRSIDPLEVSFRRQLIELENSLSETRALLS